MTKSGIKISIKFYAVNASENGWILKIGTESGWLKQITVKNAKNIMEWLEDQTKALFPDKRNLHLLFSKKAI